MLQMAKAVFNRAGGKPYVVEKVVKLKENRKKRGGIKSGSVLNKETVDRGDNSLRSRSYMLARRRAPVEQISKRGAASHGSLLVL